MSIYRRKSGRYCALIDLDPPSSGRRRRRSLGTFATRKDAERAEREALGARDRGHDLTPMKVSIADVVGRFLADAETRLSPTTIHRYRELWRVHGAPALGGIAIARLRPAHVQSLYARLCTEPRKHVIRRRDGVLDVRIGKKPLNARTIHHVHRFLHRAFAWAEKLNLVERNVIRNVEAPRPGPSPARALTPDEAAAFLDAAEGSRLHPFFVVALATGVRRGEAAAVTWQDVDLDRGLMTVRRAIGNDRHGGFFVKPTKTGKERTVPLAPLAIDALRRVHVRQAAEKLAAGAAYEDDGFVFADEVGVPLRLDGASYVFRRIARGAGLRGVTLHSLRHTSATWALANGSDVRTVSALLGHSAPSTTLNIYGHVVTGLQARAVEGIADALAVARARRAASEKRLS